MVTPLDRINSLIEKSGRSKEEFYDFIALSDSVLSTWGPGAINASGTRLFYISRKLGVSIPWLLKGEGEPELTSEQKESIQRQDHSFSNVPLIDWNDVTDYVLDNKNFDYYSKIKKWVQGRTFPGQIAITCFATRVVDDSMNVSTESLLTINTDEDTIKKRIIANEKTLCTVLALVENKLVFRDVVKDKSINYLVARNSKFEKHQLDEKCRVIGLFEGFAHYNDY